MASHRSNTCVVTVVKTIASSTRAANTAISPNVILRMPIPAYGAARAASLTR